MQNLFINLCIVSDIMIPDIIIMKFDNGNKSIWNSKNEMQISIINGTSIENTAEKH